MIMLWFYGNDYVTPKQQQAAKIRLENWNKDYESYIRDWVGVTVALVCAVTFSPLVAAISGQIAYNSTLNRSSYDISNVTGVENIDKQYSNIKLDDIYNYNKILANIKNNGNNLTNIEDFNNVNKRVDESNSKFSVACRSSHNCEYFVKYARNLNKILDKMHDRYYQTLKNASFNAIDNTNDYNKLAISSDNSDVPLIREAKNSLIKDYKISEAENSRSENFWRFYVLSLIFGFVVGTAILESFCLKHLDKINPDAITKAK